MLDEVQTGWGRTGEIMAYMNYGIKPDIVSMAKAMGGNTYWCNMREKRSGKGFYRGSHGSTYGGSPLCCAASLAAVSEIVDRDLSSNAKNVGKYFMKKLEGLPGVKEVRGMGLMIGVEFEKPIANDIKHYGVKHYLLVTAIGKKVIRMVPPLIASEKDCDVAFEVLQEAVKQIA